MTRKRWEDRPAGIRGMNLQLILEREGEAPVAVLPEGATQAPVMI
jgi:hypothetical protein